MMKRHVAFVTVCLLLLLAAVGCSAVGGDVPASGPGNAAAAKAVAWLVANHQNDDGGYTSFSAGANQAPSDPAGTLDALLALAAAGGNTEPALSYLRANGPALEATAAESAGQLGKLLLALSAAGADPRDLGGQDYVAQLAGMVDASGSFGVADAFNHSLAMLGLKSGGENVPEAAAAWLESTQAANGSWDDGFGTTDNTDATAMAIMALLAAGRSAKDASVVAAADFLAGTQAAAGGWAYGTGLPAGASSTALVVQAITALGDDPAAGDTRWAMNGRSPLDALLLYQGQSGAFQADFGDGPFDDFLSTVQAIPAAAGRVWPMAPDGAK